MDIMDPETRLIIEVITIASLIGLAISFIAIYFATKEVENGKDNWRGSV